MKKLTLILVALLTFSMTYGQLKIITNGYAGVGTTTPTEQLHVKGNSWIEGNFLYLGKDKNFIFRRTNTGASSFNHYGTAQYQFRAIDNASITFATNDIARVLVSKTGNLTVLTGNASKPGGGTWSVFSDKRLKKNITPFKDGLAEVLKINPVVFQYTKELLENNEKQYVGVIAQEIQKIAPYMTEKTETYDTEGKAKSSEYLSLDPNAFTYMLINAVQEQQEMLVEQNKIIKKLLERVIDLEKKN